MSTIILHKDKLAKTVPHEEEFLDFILYTTVQFQLTNKIIINWYGK